MTKRVTTDELSAYLDGELGESERERVRAELERDPEAARLLEELRAVDQGVRRAPAEEPAAYFDRLPGRIRAQLPVPARRARWRTPVWGLAAAAALLVAVLTPLAIRDRPSPVTAPAPAAAAAKPPAVEAPRDVPATAVPQTAPAAPAREVGGLARTEADARQLRDEQPAKRRDRLQAAESKLQPRATPAAEAKGRLTSKDDATGRDKLKGIAEEVTVPAQQGFAEPPRPAPAPAQEFGPRVSQQQAAPPPSATMKKEAAESATPASAERAAPAGFAESVTVTQEKNVAGIRAAATPAPVDFLTRKPATAAAARALREEARRFAETRPADPRADAARVRVIELGEDAWRRDGRVEDRDAARADALAYLAREDARQKDRVRELLQSLGR